VSDTADKAFACWLASRNVIAQALREMTRSYGDPETIAAAILARLASHQPPILTEFITALEEAERLREERDRLLAACKEALAEIGRRRFAAGCVDDAPSPEWTRLARLEGRLREAVAGAGGGKNDG
jgi:hypothetical protein